MNALRALAPAPPSPGRQVPSPARRSPAGAAGTAHGSRSTLSKALSDVHWAMKPPSTVMVWPVTNEAAPEHSQITASATSSG